MTHQWCDWKQQFAISQKKVCSGCTHPLQHWIRGLYEHFSGVQFPQIQLPNRSPFVTRIKVTLRIFITRTSRPCRSSQTLRGRCAAKLYTSQVTVMGKRKYECREGRLCTHVKVKHFNISYKSKSLQGLMVIHVSMTCMKTTVKTCLDSNQDNWGKKQVML